LIARRDVAMDQRVQRYNTPEKEESRVGRTLKERELK
jgi:hypothetical protein